MAATAQATPARSMTKEKSFLHTKRILAIAVSTIAYLRDLFPTDSFAERKVDDMQVHILKKDDKTAQLIDWMAGVYDALEKEYLKKVLLAVSYKSAGSEKDMLETYTFSFLYKNASISTDIDVMKDGQSIRSTPITNQDTKKSAQQFIRNLFTLVSSFDAIKSTFSITMRLMYYDDRKPTEYHPPGFEAAEEDDFEMKEDIFSTNIGKMQAPFHTMQLVIRQMQGSLKDKSIEKGKSQLQMPNLAPLSQPHCDAPLPHQSTQPVPITQSQNTQGLGVRCPCGYNNDDGSMLMCVSCNYWQHAICFCLAEDVGFQSVCHICNNCGDVTNPDMYPTDVTLMDLDENQLREVCMWRRALLACYGTTRVNVTSLSRRLSCSKVLAKSIVDKLVMENIAKPVKSHNSYKDIDKDNLDSVFYRDVKKLAQDMRKQIVEAKANASSKGTPEVRKPLSPINDDETPMKLDNSPRGGTRSAKRHLGIGSQDSVIQPPAPPAKVKKTKRAK